MLIGVIIRPKRRWWQFWKPKESTLVCGRDFTIADADIIFNPGVVNVGDSVTITYKGEQLSK